MKSLIVRRSFVIAPGRKTSAALEHAFWTGLQEIAGRRHMSLAGLIRTVVAQGPHKNLSSALRQFVLEFYRSQAVSAEITVPHPPQPPASQQAPPDS
jgi:predicted DNA-binding ribbon-helix-helix protein